MGRTCGAKNKTAEERSAMQPKNGKRGRPHGAKNKSTKSKKDGMSGEFFKEMNKETSISAKRFEGTVRKQLYHASEICGNPPGCPVQPSTVVVTTTCTCAGADDAIECTFCREKRRGMMGSHWRKMLARLRLSPGAAYHMTRRDILWRDAARLSRLIRGPRT